MRFSSAENLGEKSEAERFEAFEYGRFLISVRLTSDWFRRWRGFSKPISEQSDKGNKSKINAILECFRHSTRTRFV